MKPVSFRNMLILIGIGCCLGMAAGCSSSSNAQTSTPRNIIFMVPDGMGLSNVTIARIYKNGPNGSPLNLETLPYIGYQRTHSRNSTVTDSAAAARITSYNVCYTKLLRTNPILFISAVMENPVKSFWKIMMELPVPFRPVH